MSPLEELQAELAKITPDQAKERFTDLFSRGYTLLELTDPQGAVLFSTSTPTFSRWRRGLVVPPAANLVLRFLREAIERKIQEQT